MRRYLTIVGATATLTYFFDPVSGRDRRRAARDRVVLALARTLERLKARPEPQAATETVSSPPAHEPSFPPEPELERERVPEPAREPAFVTFSDADLAHIRTPQAEASSSPPAAQAPPAGRPGEPPWALSEDELLKELSPSRSRTLPLVVAVVTALTAAAAAGIAVWAFTDDDGGRPREIASETRALVETQTRAIDVLASLDAKRIPVQGTKGRVVLVLAPSGSAVLVVRDFAPAPAGKTYQAWVIVGENPRSAGVFEADSGAARVVPLTLPVPRGAVVAVTLEPSGGLSSPSGKPLFAAKRA